MAIPAADPDECLQHAYRYVRSQRKRLALTTEEVEDAVGELVCYMVTTMLPNLDRGRSLGEQRSWWHRTTAKRFHRWRRDKRNIIRIAAGVWERGGPSQAFAFLDDERDDIGQATSPVDVEAEVIGRVDFAAWQRRARLTSREGRCLRLWLEGSGLPLDLTEYVYRKAITGARVKMRRAAGR